MKKLIFILIILIVTNITCDNQNKNAILKKKSNLVILKTNEIKKIMKERELDSIIFGIYCGECVENCSNMFLLTISNGKPIFLTDSSDNYFNSQYKFRIKINHIDKLKLVNEILSNIPDILYNWKDNNMVFGCPDCDDSCGYYLELVKNNGESKSFNLDVRTETEQIPKNILNFTKLLSNNIDKLSE